MLKGNAIIGQSGGPTSVINSSLAGVIETARNSTHIKNVYGMNYGIEGFMNKQIIDLGNQPEHIIQGLKKTPSSALGSSRHKLVDADLPVVLDVLKTYDIRYFFLIGGNDTMDTINRVEKYCRETGYELIGVGIPKTVDNDLFGTDHTPGFASAAMSNILNVLQAGILARDMQKVDKFVVYQTIGRDAGWLGAATALAKSNEEDAPHLIYTPEHVFNKDRFIEDVSECIKRYGWAFVVCGEGLKYENGTPVSSSQTQDKFKNVEFGAMGGSSVGLNLHRMISDALGYRGEFQITESLIMSAMDRAVPQDIEEAFMCGSKAVHLAENGESGYMVTIERTGNDPYRVNYGKILLNDVAIKAKPMPEDYFNPDKNFISNAFLEYMHPLIGKLPEFVKLEKKYV